MLKFGILGSGSSGNSIVVQNRFGCILVDIGFNCQRMLSRLMALGIPVEKISAVLISHEHSDHVKGINVFCSKFGVPVFCTSETRAIIAPKIRNEIIWREITAGQKFSIQTERGNEDSALEIDCFSVLHDAADPLAFTISSYFNKANKDHKAKSTIGIATDCGYVNNIMKDKFSEVDTLVIESNYDEDLLREDSKRPWQIKQRVASRHGHLSNEQCADFLVSLAKSGRLNDVILAHLSGDCNEPLLPLKAVEKKFNRHFRHKELEFILNSNLPHPSININGLKIQSASQEDPLGLFTVKSGCNNDFKIVKAIEQNKNEKCLSQKMLF